MEFFFHFSNFAEVSLVSPVLCSFSLYLFLSLPASLRRHARDSPAQDGCAGARAGAAARRDRRRRLLGGEEERSVVLVGVIKHQSPPSRSLLLLLAPAAGPALCVDQERRGHVRARPALPGRAGELVESEKIEKEIEAFARSKGHATNDDFRGHKRLLALCAPSRLFNTCEGLLDDPLYATARDRSHMRAAEGVKGRL